MGIPMHGNPSERPNAGLAWIKSSLSFSNGNCVEVARLPGSEIGVRNSRDPDGPVLTFTPAQWAAFLGRARRGDFISASPIAPARRSRAG